MPPSSLTTRPGRGHHDGLASADPAEPSRGTVILGVAGSDTHVVANYLIAHMLREDGYRVVNLGACTPLAEFMEAYAAHPDALAIMIGSVNGHAKDDLRQLGTLKARYGVRCPVILGGNLSVGSHKELGLTEYYQELGVDLVITQPELMRTHLRTLADASATQHLTSRGTHMKTPDQLGIAIVGATGAVGTTLLELFEQRGFPFRELRLIASPRSAGKTVQVRGRAILVEDLEQCNFSGVDIAFFSAGTSISKLHARRAAAEGALVIDNTNAHRMDADTPLVVPQVNRHALRARPSSGIIANPNCSTIPMVRALHCLDPEYGVHTIIVSTYQAASGQGLTGIEELRAGSQLIMAEPSATVPAVRFPAPLAFNLVPSIDALLDTGFTVEERKMLDESRKILGRPGLRVSATAVRVPVVTCHSEAVYFECDRPLALPRMLELLRAGEEIQVHHGTGPDNYPTPRTITNFDDVHVGRIRIDPENPRAGWLWVVSDNLRVGAALNAIQIAEEMIANGVLAKRTAA
jgi:aspartate-semialdehyde dehydrogenase